VTTTTALIAATAALALGAAGPAAAAAPATCGNVKTTNGGTAKNIHAQRISCTSARAIAKKANGKIYKASGFTCARTAGAYVCFKKGSTRRILFIYNKPS
jgi:hypothetical protein